MNEFKEKVTKWTEEHPVATRNIGFGIIFCLGYRAGMKKGYKMTLEAVNYAIAEASKMFTHF